MRLAVLGLGFLLAGCAEMSPNPPAPLSGDGANGAKRAYFAEYPRHLFFAAAEVCAAPGQTVVKPSRNEVRCESLPDPESAAALILQFNGTVESLPTFVISFSGQKLQQGYLVTADNYIRVPQRSGAARQVRFPDMNIGAEMAELLEAAGGRPL